MDLKDEQNCIERIKNGDSGAYTFIVDAYKHMAFTIAMKILNDEEDAQDTAQEGFIKAFQQLNQFQGKSKFSTWLYTIVYRTAISKLKENKVQTQPINLRISENYSEDNRSPQEEMQAKDEQYYVKNAIQKLPQTEALLVTLFYLNENSTKEIHEITGLSLANIKINLFRARKKLERELQFLMNKVS